MAGFEIKGLRELRQALKTLGEEVQTRACGAATNAGAQVIKAAYIENAPVAGESYEIEGITVAPGNIGRNVIVKRIAPGDTPHTSEHIVTVRGGAKHGYASRIGSIYEYGGEGPGNRIQAPRPFARTAWDNNKERAAQAMIETLGKRIEAAALKAKK